jgi:hypothetical protein
MSRTQNLVVAGLLIAAAATLVLWLQLREHAGATPAAAVPGAPTAATRGEPGPGSAAAPKPRVRRLADPSGRDELLRQIRDVHAKRTPRPATTSSSGTTTPPPALPPPTLEKEYIRASVRELIPLLVECYEQGLERDPKLAGSIIVDFTIEGEPGVGGVVGESAIDATASTLTDPAVRECVQETMFGIEIEPPAGGGVVKVRYPFEFRAGTE